MGEKYIRFFFIRDLLKFDFGVKKIEFCFFFLFFGELRFKEVSLMDGVLRFLFLVCVGNGWINFFGDVMVILFVSVGFLL